MDNQIQGEVIGSSEFALSHLECATLDESLHAVTHAALRNVCIVIDGLHPPSCGTYADTRMSHIGAGFAEAMKQMVGNALLPNVCKAN